MNGHQARLIRRTSPQRMISEIRLPSAARVVTACRRWWDVPRRPRFGAGAFLSKRSV